MIARLQRTIVLGLILFGTAWAALWWRAGHPGWAALALLVPFVHAPVLGLEFILLAWVQRGHDGPKAGPGALLRAWWVETWTGWVVFGWRQPFRASAWPDHLPPSCRGQPALVLVHGFACNRGVWNGWMRRLRQRGRPYVAVNLEPIHGSIDAYAAEIDSAVRRAAAATGRSPWLVAHSMGGLAARAWLAAHGADHRVDGVVTIGTPHRGTWLGRFSRARNGRQMRLDGPWTRALAELEPAARHTRFVCYWSECDNIVFPALTATLPGADNRRIAGVPHVALVDHPRIFEEVVGRIDGGHEERMCAAPQAGPGKTSTTPDQSTRYSRSPGSTAPASTVGSSRTAR